MNKKTIFRTQLQNKSILRAAAAILICTLLTACGETEEIPETKVDVETCAPAVKDLSLKGSFIGTIETGEKVSVISQVSGKVTLRNFKVGDHVNAGDVLFTIDDRELQIEKHGAEAALSSARSGLEAQKLSNEATKAAATESLGLMAEKEQELNNNVVNAERDRINALHNKELAEQQAEKYKKDMSRIEDSKRRAGDKAHQESGYARQLRGYRNKYNEIANAGTNAASIAKSAGVSDSDIGSTSDAEEIARIYIRSKTSYSNYEELTTALEAAEEAASSADSEKNSLEESYTSTMYSKMEAELNSRIGTGNLATAEDAKKLAEKIKQDYELYTKATIMSDAQAKLAEGDAAVEASEAQLVSAQASLDALNLKLDQTTVTAPVGGIIQEINVVAGGIIAEQSPAYVIEASSGKKVQFYVSENIRSRLSYGQTVSLEKDGQAVTAVISFIAETPDDAKKLFRVDAAIENGGEAVFTPGCSVKLETVIETAPAALTVPIKAVYYTEGKAYVFVAENGKAMKRDIETGLSDETDIQVVSGLTAKDNVIVSWSAQLRDQTEINPVKSAVKEETTAETAGTEAQKETTEEPDKTAKAKAEEMPAVQAKTEFVMTTDRVNIRSGPGTDNEKLATVSAGEKFECTGKTDDGWTKVRYGDSEGYIKSEYVKQVSAE